MKPFKGPKRQGGWVMAALAVAQGISSAMGAKKAQNGVRNQKRAIRRQAEEQFRSDAKVRDAVLGAQQARAAASGAAVGVGSVATLLEETRDEYQRNVAANAYLTEQRLKGASIEGNTAQYAAMGNYFSAAGQFATSVRETQKSANGWSSFWS